MAAGQSWGRGLLNGLKRFVFAVGLMHIIFYVWFAVTILFFYTLEWRVWMPENAQVLHSNEGVLHSPFDYVLVREIYLPDQTGCDAIRSQGDFHITAEEGGDHLRSALKTLGLPATDHGYQKIWGDAATMPHIFCAEHKERYKIILIQWMT